VVAYFIVSSDGERSRRLYADVLAGEVLLEGDPSIVALANGWVTIGGAGEPTPDKPTITLQPPSDPDRVSAFLREIKLGCRPRMHVALP
jgi:hypothetical protein